MGLDQLGQLLDLAAAQACGRMEPWANLDHLMDNLDPRGCRQPPDLIQRLVAVDALAPVQNADQDATLPLDVELFSLWFSQLQSAIGWRG